MSDALIGRLIDAAATEIRAASDRLTQLDQAIGDGDHGINMKRGFEEIAADRTAIAAQPFGQALQKAGMALVMKVGGASGPLYGSLLMAMGKACPEPPQTIGAVADLFEAGVDAVRKRGKSDAGAKTMLDVLVPVATVVRGCATQAAGGKAPDLATTLSMVRATADESLEATRPMRATKGRASYLGERSIGHLDPGATSSRLLIHAVCDVLEGTR